jgi:hypothetical protein
MISSANVLDFSARILDDIVCECIKNPPLFALLFAFLSGRF